MATTRVERALVAWACLGEQIKTADLYEGLFTFIRPITRQWVGKRFVPSDLATALIDAYSLRVPVLVLESLAERMIGAGILERDLQAGDASAFNYKTSDKDSAPKINEAAISGLLEKFRAYVRSEIGTLSSETDEKLNEEFFDRLLNVDSLALLGKKDLPEPIKKSQGTLSLKKDFAQPVIRPERQMREHIDYVFSSFLLAVKEESDADFDLLAEVAGANLIAEALLTYRNPPGKGEALQSINIYLDGPLCLDMLGANVSRENYGSELLKLIKDSGVGIRVYLHTVGEIDRIIDSRAESYTKGFTRGNSIYSVEPAKIRERVQVIRGHVESMLKDIVGAEVFDSKAVIAYNNRIKVGPQDEAEVRKFLDGWEFETRREVDITSVCETIRLRAPLRPSSRITEVGSLFVTRNSVLRDAANSAWYSWLRRSGVVSQDRIAKIAPLAVSDKYLAGLIWITNGGDASEFQKVGRAFLVSNCSAATAARRDVVVKVHNALVGTSPQDAEMFAALICDQRAERVLMDRTFGDQSVITDDRVPELLAEMRRATIAEVVAEKDVEVKAIEDKARLALEKVRAERDEMADKNLAAESAARALIQERRVRHEADAKSVQWSFEFARAFYRYSNSAVTVIACGIVYVAQVVVPNFLDASQKQSVLFRVLDSRLSLAALFIASTLLVVGDNPSAILKTRRKHWAIRIFHLISNMRGVGVLAENSSLDFEAQCIRVPEFAMNDAAKEAP
jgi:hypothetical protein